MLNPIKRYMNPDVIEHIALRYTLGHLTPRARARADSLVRLPEYQALKQEIEKQQMLLQPLHDAAPTIAPDPKIWRSLAAEITSEESNIEPLKPKPSVRQKNIGPFLSMAASVLFVALLALFIMPSEEQRPALSYVAVMTDAQNNAAIVAATYGEGQGLVLDLVNLPQIENDVSYELWVTSKTDAQTRSLGLISAADTSIIRPLNNAEWRLIKDSATLLVTVEELGGSPLGEPLGEVVAEGLCVRLSAWEA
ncbi:anti-sigma factor [Alteromonas oceanisediminis]|uniref:anti-sigma factor n=1 Tax=Alteromonas oceanisediminis TaxID=2836180 RepID=UPI001BDB274C|nr:anti-sigma factor [Alteromonas oceanisediminis]MBT0586996.1 anti-sigma factor [Alteromonas oceanisediminis]